MSDKDISKICETSTTVCWLMMDVLWMNERTFWSVLVSFLAIGASAFRVGLEMKSKEWKETLSELAMLSWILMNLAWILDSEMKHAIAKFTIALTVCVIYLNHGIKRFRI